MTALTVIRSSSVNRETSVPPLPKADPISVGLLLAMAYCVSGAIDAVGWAEGTEFLVLQSLLAVLIAYVLSRSAMRAWLAVTVGVLGLLAVVLVTVGGLWPPVTFVSEDLARLGLWWSDLVRGGPSTAGWPFPAVGGYVSRQVTAIVWRTWVWGWRVYAGAANSDRQVWLLVISTGLSLTTFASSWQVFRHWRVSLALLLLGTALGANSFMAGQEPTWALAFIGFGLVLLTRGNALRLERRWLFRGTDYSDELLPYVTVIGLGLAAIAVILSPLLPVLTSRSTYEAFWRLVREPWSRVEETTGKWFQGLDSPPRRGLIPSGEAGPIDPSAEHRVGAGAPQGNQIVFRVRTGDPAPEPWAGGIGRLNEDVLPQRHWRAATFDTYTGSGWVNGAREVEDVAADDALAVDHPETRREFSQQVSRRGDTVVVYAVGQPFRVDQDLTVTYREAEDVVSLAGSEDDYTVVSLVPDVTVSGLEAAGTDYPAEIAERYLALSNVPERVRRTALEVAGGAETAYGKTRAIEEYLRRFEYDLAVPASPEGRDVVDYFLYDLQRGFCDHFSTAMAVMLRLNGIPARIAVGYARGTYDDREGYWVVTEADSHAWVEVYFPEYGWVEFEPTPSQSVYFYPLGDTWDKGSASLPDPPRADAGWRPSISIATARILLVGVLLTVVAFRIAGAALKRRRYRPDDHIAAAYGRLVRSGRWVGISPQPNETVREYWRRLRQALSEGAIFVSTPWGTEWVWQFERVATPARYVLSAYERSQFGPDELGLPVARRAAQEADRLRREFALLWVARRIGE